MGAISGFRLNMQGRPLRPKVMPARARSSLPAATAFTAGLESAGPAASRASLQSDRSPTSFGRFDVDAERLEAGSAEAGSATHNHPGANRFSASLLREKHGPVGSSRTARSVSRRT